MQQTSRLFKTSSNSCADMVSVFFDAHSQTYVCHTAVAMATWVLIHYLSAILDHFIVIFLTLTIYKPFKERALFEKQEWHFKANKVFSPECTCLYNWSVCFLHSVARHKLKAPSVQNLHFPVWLILLILYYTDFVWKVKIVKWQLIKCSERKEQIKSNSLWSGIWIIW